MTRPTRGTATLTSTINMVTGQLIKAVYTTLRARSAKQTLVTLLKYEI